MVRLPTRASDMLRRRRQIAYRLLNTGCLLFLTRLQRWYGQRGAYIISTRDPIYVRDDVRYLFHFRYFGAAGNIDVLDSYEAETLAGIVELIPEKGVFYDVGAHEGFFSLAVLQSRPDVVAVAFEPLADNLKVNLELNEARSVRVFEVGLSDHEGAGHITTGLRSSNRIIHSAATGSRLVPLTRLDDIRSCEGLPCPSLLKIDVEGLEAAVIRGGMNTITECMPFIVMEVNSNYVRYGENMGELVGSLQRLGYCPKQRRRGEWLDVSDLDDLLGSDGLAENNLWLIPPHRNPDCMR